MGWSIFSDRLLDSCHLYAALSLSCIVFGKMPAMTTGQYILEVFGVAVVGIGAFLLTRIFALAPLQRDLTKMESTCHFCFIPVLVYSSFRLYFGILFHFTKTLSNTRPHVGKFGVYCWLFLFDYVLDFCYYCWVSLSMLCCADHA